MSSSHDDPTRTVIARPDLSPVSGEDDRVHYLVAVEGAQRGKRIELGNDAVVIGRSAPATVVIRDGQISRSHCRVQLVMGEVIVTDLGSSNGTFVGAARLESPCVLEPGERMKVGMHVLEHEWRSRREVQAALDLDSDLLKASQYVRALLPAPLTQGPIRTDWVLLPSARMGGDVFGYHFIDERTFAIYLLDVTGHGTEAAMHAVSVVNVLRQRTLPGVDVRNPAHMARHLNAMFEMESHGNMLQSLWHGVFDLAARTLDFTSAGHHPAYLVPSGRELATPLDVSNVLIGMMPGYDYRGARVEVAAGSTLYLFSDGAFEIEAADGREWGIDDFVSLLSAPRQPDKAESRRLLETVAVRTGRQSFEDDFTLVVAEFK